MKFNLDKKARKSELSTKKRFKKYDDAILKELPNQKRTKQKQTWKSIADLTRKYSEIPNRKRRK